MVPRRSAMWRRLSAALVLLALAGCASAPPQTPTPASSAPPTPASSAPPTPATSATAPATGASQTGTPPAGTPSPVESGLVSPEPIGTFPPEGPTPLPEPSLNEPFDIGVALADPNRVSDGVISLLAQMGVEIQAADGGVIRPGRDVGFGQLVLTEEEVRGWIEMTGEDLAALNETGEGPVRLADFNAALRPSLPDGYTLDDLVAGYSNAYADTPDALVPQVMLGMPVDPAFGLTRLQQWLLLVDGFVGSGAPFAGSALAAHVAGVQFPGHAFAAVGVARQYQPPLTSQIPGMSDVEWAYLLARIPTLAYTIPFNTSPPANVHEGHGGPGRPVTGRAEVRLPPPLVFPQNGHVLLDPHSNPSGITLEWTSSAQGVLARHGSINGSLPMQVVTDASGTVTITYTPKKEKADGRGLVVKEVGSLYAQADASDLIRNTYFVARSAGAIDAVEALATGKVRSRGGEFPIAWHEEDVYELYIRNKFDVTLEVGTGQQGLVNVRRVGRNEAKGVIYNNGDGTYRGTLSAWVFGSMDGSFFMGECHDQTDAQQAIYAVGHVIDGAGIPPNIYVAGTQYGMVPANYAMKDLMMYFYPASTPGGTLGPCQGTMEFVGGGPDNQPKGVFLPFNDSRWTAALNTTNWQDGIGLGIFLPKEGTLDYTDNRQQRPDLLVESQWNIVVTKVRPP